MARITIRAIVAQVSAETGISVQDIVSSRRLVASISSARQEAMLRAREAGYTYPLIARVFGRHHTTVISGCRRALARRPAKRIAA